MEPNTAYDIPMLSGAWVVGFNKELYPENPTYGPFAGRPGSVRFSPVKGSKVQAVQRGPPNREVVAEEVQRLVGLGVVGLGRGVSGTNEPLGRRVACSPLVASLTS